MTRREFIRLAQAHGWRYRITGSGHMRWTHAGTGAQVTSSWTPGDERAWINALADMRRALRRRA